MEVKSMKGIKFKDAVIPVKELKKLIKEIRSDVKFALKMALKGAREDLKNRDMIEMARSGQDVIWWASQLTLLDYLEMRIEEYERKE